MKTTKATKPAAKPSTTPAATKSKAAKKPRAAKVEIFKPVKKYEDGGMREKARTFIPSKGATFDTILKASKIPQHKLRRYLRGLVRHGCVKRLAA